MASGDFFDLGFSNSGHDSEERSEVVLLFTGVMNYKFH
jgi:hypothetical protein